MDERGIPGTSLTVTELGFGGASLGNLYRETSDDEAAAAVAQAWASGIRYFDTAPHYGLGLSERRLGAALAAHPRDEYVISTKVGRLLVPQEAPTERDDAMFEVPGAFRRQWDFSRDGVLRSIESSLDRLGTDRLDVVYLHDPDESGIPDAAEKGAAALIELRDEGVVSAVGIGSNSADAVTELFSRADIDLAMVAGRYTLLEHDSAEALFEAAGTRSIVVAGVFNSGLLAAARPVDGAMYNYEPAPAELLERANELATIAERHGATLPQAALAFALNTPRVASVVLGMRTAEQVVQNVALLQARPPVAMWDEILATG